MNKKCILKYIISLFFALCANYSWTQEKVVKVKDSLAVIETDTIRLKKSYEIRLGLDISRPVMQLAQEQEIGLELTLDYRLAANWYIASEFGYESEIGHEEIIDFYTRGNYAKLGFNYNAYENLSGMNNEVYVGLRYGFSKFQQELNNFTILDLDDYFGDYTEVPNRLYEGLSAHWAELHFGLKVETLPNLFLTASVHFKKLISDKEPEGFANLYIPGFNKVFLNGSGVGFNYTIAYLIPLKKK